MELIVYNHGSRDINKIALMFDDGPNPFWTREILDVLDKYDVKANFFVLGKWAEKHRDIVKETFERGHLIGNHTYSHPREGSGDFEKAEEIIFDIIGEHTRFVRPPYLAVELCKNYQPVLKGEARIINCDVFPEDYHKEAEDIKRIIYSGTQNGSIIAIHDGSQREEELENRPAEMFKALPEVLKELKKRFEFVRLDELTF
ncbi:polysaccharide deacetylase family protein [Patescibacteria group bacterium]|nr:polysaccharide deacetylase family protein [Patescibacteria group bacterium]